MLSRINGSIWEEEEGTIPWTRNTIEGGENHKDEMGSLTTFKSMLEDDNWGYINSTNQNPSSHHDFQSIHNHHEIIRDLPFSSNPISSQHLLLQPPSIDSSSSCSQSSVFNLDPSQVQSFLSPKSSLSSLLNVVYNNNNNNNNNPFENSFDLSCESGFLMGNQNSSSNFTGLSNLISQTQMGTPDLCSNNQFSNTHLTNWSENGSNIGIGSNSTTGFGGFENPSNSDFLRSKVLKPLEILPPVGSQPTLFQKRAALRQNSSGNDKNGNLVGLMSLDEKGKREMDEQVEKWRNTFEEDEGSIDGSGLNYDTDEAMENNKFEDSIKNGGNNSNANSTITNGGQKGKKKGLPAKNLMAERRRRKKLNDRLYMLRSVVPKISKMDRASILGDAIEYLKELLQKINDLHNELETTPLGSSIPPSSSFHPSSPTPATLPCRVKEELCSSSLSSPNNQPARVEVRAREGRAVNIHMFCSRRPGLLLSTMRALDDIGIDIQQAVISCFNGFALDVFQAEQNKEGMDIPPEEIKAVLLSSAGFIGTA